MADVYSKIAEKLKEIARDKKMSETTIFPAQVKSINETTCTVLIDNLEVTDVRLRAVINDKTEQLLITPKIDSYVLIADLSGGDMRDFAVIAYSEVDEISIKEIPKVNIKIENQTLQIDKNGFIFNGGDLGGLIKIQELTDRINDLINAFNSHTHTLAPGSVVVVGSAATQNNAVPITVPAITSQAQAFRKSDYENEKVKH